MGNKLIKNVDDNIWGNFTNNCKSKKKLVGKQLNAILQKYLKEDK